MTLQQRYKVTSFSEWTAWQDWNSTGPIRFNHAQAASYAHEVREKPPFSPSHWQNTDGSNIYRADDVATEQDYRGRSYTQVLVSPYRKDA